MTATIRTPARNRLIMALPSSDRERFPASCEYVELAFADVFIEGDEKCRHVTVARITVE